uniref:Pre-mRNA-splicing factor SYF1 n=1 Tax=Romanomermis culicivorax TaxID=13658 RepID=A0A915II81_ROMCU
MALNFMRNRSLKSFTTLTSYLKFNVLPPLPQHIKTSFSQEEADLPYEEDILRNPYSVRCWLRYIEHKKQTKSPIQALVVLYERALKELPGSYKLWYQYLLLRRKQYQGRCITDHCFEDVNNCFRRALVFMHKMPRIWLDYLEFMINQKKITQTRKIFNDALRSLPLTQHDRIWPLYLKFVRSYDISETAIRVYRRYLKLMPENAEDYIEFLLSIDKLDEAAQKLAFIVNDDKFDSKKGKSKYQLWHELCELISKNPTKIKSLKVEAIIRQGIRKYTDQVGALWCSLSEYFVRAGLFERARDVYEEAIQTVVTVRDFTQVYEAFVEFMDHLVNAKMKTASDTETDIEVEMYMDRYEDLLFRRPILLNSVLLRQNPHDVHEWHKRVELFSNNFLKQVETYTEALKIIDPKLQTGKVNTLWVGFAKLYEKHEQIDDARTIFEKALTVNYTKVDDLASVWCEFAEMEMRHNDFDRALKLLKRATAAPPQRTYYFDEKEPVQNRVYKSLKVWTLYADVQETLDDFDACKAVYDRIIDLKIATPQIIFNYAMFLEESNHFEEAFKVYEKGVALFRWPHVEQIWNTYLVKFIKRYGGKKLERVRDLFEECLESCPPEHAKNFFLLYAKVEEEHGLARRAMEIYDRATNKISKEDMYEIFNLYIKKASELYGVTHARPIYESAIEKLPDDRAREMCIRFAELECKLGEIDRARAVYSHCSQLCDPRVHANFWEIWKNFEVKHGNEDTVREMLRIKRSVQAMFNTQVNFMSAQMTAAASGQKKTVADMTAADSMALLEAKAQQLSEEAKSATKKPSGISFVRAISTENTTGNVEEAADNPDEIDLEEDMDQDEIYPKKRDVEVVEQVIPTEVFGSLANEDD